MSTITYCDACGKEAGNDRRTIGMGYHVGKTDDMSYHPVGRPMKRFDLCGRCLNIVETAAYEAFLGLGRGSRERSAHIHHWALSMDGGTYVCECGAWK